MYGQPCTDPEKPCNCVCTQGRKYYFHYVKLGGT